MKIENYPSLQKSPIPGLKRIPSHWEVRRLKELASISFSNVDKHSKEDELPVRLCNYTDVYHNDFITDEIEFMEATANETEIARFSLQRGDILITKDSESWDDIAVPAHVSQTLDNVLCGYHLAMVRPHAIDSKYLFRAFSTYSINRQFALSVSGVTRFGLGKSAISDAFFLVPPPEEQQAIADYLDKETAKIDALAVAMERLLVVLAEKRQAVITHAVTRGLDPDAPLRDSGVEWIGKIPDTWSVNQLKFLCESLQTGPFGSQLHVSDYVDSGIPVINPAHLINGRIVPDKRVTVDEKTANRLSMHRIESGDVLLARRGEIGRCAVVTEREAGWLCGTGSLRLRPNREVLDSFYLMSLLMYSSVATQLLALSVGTTMKNINTEIVGNLFVPSPDLEEQIVIAKEIGRVTRRIDSLGEVVQESVLLLQERRTSLISAAVTGQIRITT